MNLLILPEKNNLPYVAWATSSYLWELLQYGTRVYYQPPPFAHSKLLLAHSGETSLAQMDGRSLPVKLRDGLAKLLSPYL